MGADRRWPANNLSCEGRGEALNNYIAYEHIRTDRSHVGWEGIPIPRLGLELYNGSRFYRERSFLDAFSCPMARVGATRREYNSSFVLVLEHCRKHADVPVLYFPAGPRWDPGLSPKLAHLHSQLDADSETQVRFHGCRTIATPTRNRVNAPEVSLWADRGFADCGYDFSVVGSTAWTSSSSA